MKCAKCGAELRLGCIYCSVCGKEAQIVSETNLLEEELLRELLKEETEDNSSQTPNRELGKVQSKNGESKKKSHKLLIISLSCLVALLILAVVLVVVIRNKNQNSFTYQVTKAESYTGEKNYVKALEYYKHALELEADDIPVRFQMVELYLLMEEERSAVSMLHEIISMDSSNEAAYQKLISLYAQEKDYEAILKLKEELKDDALLELFAEYEVMTPWFNLEPGSYAEHITIELEATENDRIYYTTDGSDPVVKGKLYEEPFEMEEQGNLEIKAVACNEYDIYSEVIEGEFVVEYKKPQMAKANPDRGSFFQPTTISLTGPEGCHIYYTWDGTDPSVASAEYTAPIEIPEGDHILSVILVDKYGMYSDILKCNYKYFPEKQELPE